MKADLEQMRVQPEWHSGTFQGLFHGTQKGTKKSVEKRLSPHPQRPHAKLKVRWIYQVFWVNWGKMVFSRWDLINCTRIIWDTNSGYVWIRNACQSIIGWHLIKSVLSICRCVPVSSCMGKKYPRETTFSSDPYDHCYVTTENLTPSRKDNAIMRCVFRAWMI